MDKKQRKEFRTLLYSKYGDKYMEDKESVEALYDADFKWVMLETRAGWHPSLTLSEWKNSDFVMDNADAIATAYGMPAWLKYADYHPAPRSPKILTNHLSTFPNGYIDMRGTDRPLLQSKPTPYLLEIIDQLGDGPVIHSFINTKLGQPIMNKETKRNRIKEIEGELAKIKRHKETISIIDKETKEPNMALRMHFAARDKRNDNPSIGYIQCLDGCLVDVPNLYEIYKTGLAKLEGKLNDELNSLIA